MIFRDTETGFERQLLSPAFESRSVEFVRSADEQVDFLKRFYTGQLSASARSTAIVKDIMLLEQTATYKLSGKTGAAPLEKGGTLAWFVGYLEREGNVYFFALNMDGANYEAVRDERINLTKRILKELGCLPEGS